MADINRIKGRIQDIRLSEEVVYRDRCKTRSPVLAASHEGNDCFMVPKLLYEGHFTVHLNCMFWFPPNSISFHNFILLIDILNALFCKRQNNFRYKTYTWWKKQRFSKHFHESGFFNWRQLIIPLYYVCCGCPLPHKPLFRNTSKQSYFFYIVKLYVRYINSSYISLFILMFTIIVNNVVYIWCCITSLQILMWYFLDVIRNYIAQIKRIGGVMVSVLASSAEDRGSSPGQNKSKTITISICYFSAKHAALRCKSNDCLARNRDNVV